MINHYMPVTQQQNDVVTVLAIRPLAAAELVCRRGACPNVGVPLSIGSRWVGVDTVSKGGRRQLAPDRN